MSTTKITSSAESMTDDESAARLAEMDSSSSASKSRSQGSAAEPSALALLGMHSVLASARAGGPRDAFHTRDVYRKYGPQLLRRALWNVGKTVDAEDLVQVALIRRAVHLSRGGSIQNEAAFLNKVLGNLIVDFYRERGRWNDRHIARELDENDFLTQISGWDIEEAYLTEDLRKAVQQLPPLQRAIIFSIFALGMSGNEVAEQLHTSPQVVSRLKGRALKTLSDALA